MSEVWKGTKNTIKGIALIPITFITPTKNKFSPTDPNEDNRSTEPNQSPPESPLESKSDTDSEAEDSDDDYQHKMTTTDYEMVKDLVEDTAVLIPKPHPSLMDVINFKQEVINAFTLCNLQGNQNGHLYILETNIEYSL